MLKTFGEVVKWKKVLPFWRAPLQSNVLLKLKHKVWNDPLAGPSPSDHRAVRWSPPSCWHWRRIAVHLSAVEETLFIWRFNPHTALPAYSYGRRHTHGYKQWTGVRWQLGFYIAYRWLSTRWSPYRKAVLWIVLTENHTHTQVRTWFTNKTHETGCLGVFGIIMNLQTLTAVTVRRLGWRVAETPVINLTITGWIKCEPDWRLGTTVT